MTSPIMVSSVKAFMCRRIDSGAFLTYSQGAVLHVQLHSHRGISEEDRLLRHLFRGYEHRSIYSRPVHNFNHTVTVRFGLQLIQIMDLDERNQILTLNVWSHYNWTDVHMMWNATEFHGVNKIRIPCGKIWTPDIKLYNYADERLVENRNALCIVKPNGQVEWIPQAIFKSSCDINVKSFPFDVQTCYLKFGSWAYDGSKVDLLFKNGQNESTMLLSDYQESNIWDIIETPAKRNAMEYACCPDEPFVDLNFSLVIRRKATFYSYTLILPCVLLTSLTLVLFWIPPESPAKMTLGMSVFMAYFVLLLLFESSLPPAATTYPILGMNIFMAYFVLLLMFNGNIPPASTTPVLGTYYCLNMILITLSSFLCVIVVNLTFYGTRVPVHVPYTLKKVMFNYVAKCLCMGNFVSPFVDDVHITCPSSSHRYVGVNGDGSKFANDWKGSNELLVTSLQKETNLELVQIHTKVNEVRNFIKLYKERLEEKDRKDKVAKEWRTLALVFDRIFFIIYLSTIMISLTVVMSVLWS
ncbi:hypothetical protein FSP39_006302 [Pinctada imbricata]|uniref:Uncharacterized protein n=1 Tax=Pinctada imbricata TaxID=66713 RepID=A0AA88XQ82_PINIB|nr:hypothetical protein FSP39_006302 [Pinctada imbricata]